MASLQARHVRKCAVGKPWTPVDGATSGCTCPGGPTYHVVMWKNGGQHREHAGQDLAKARALLEQRIAERAAAKGKVARVPAPVLEAPAPGAVVVGSLQVRVRTSAGAAQVTVEAAVPGSGVWRAVGAAPVLEGAAQLDVAVAAEPDGALALRAVADGIASAPVEVAVDNQGPVVRITSPADGEGLTESVLVYAAAHDAGSGVRGVRLLASTGGDWLEIATVEEPPFAGSWTPPADAQHAWLTAVAWDASGRHATSEYVSLVRGAAPAVQAAAEAAAADPVQSAVDARVQAAVAAGAAGRAPVTLAQLHALRATATGNDAVQLDALIAAVSPYVTGDGPVPAELDGLVAEYAGHLLG